jgi:hypothetical protein
MTTWWLASRTPDKIIPQEFKTFDEAADYRDNVLTLIDPAGSERNDYFITYDLDEANLSNFENDDPDFCLEEYRESL